MGLSTEITRQVNDIVDTIYEDIDSLDDRVASLEADYGASYMKFDGTTVVSDPPTAAELTAAFGTPATVGAGFIGLIGSATTFYFTWSDNTNWFYTTGTQAV